MEQPGLSSTGAESGSMTFWLLSRLQLVGASPEQLWKPHHSLSVQDWLEDTARRRLFVYLDAAGQIIVDQCQSGLPNLIRSGAIRSFNYFFKRTTESISPDTLDDAVAFGAIHDKLLPHLLAIMNSVFVPVAMTDHGWPENIRREFFAQIQKFMASITEMTYQAQGATVLYIPTDPLADIEASARDKDLVYRLESTLRHWTRQIKELTNLAQQDSVHDAESAGPLDEVQYWRARDVDLSRLHAQLQAERLQRVVQVGAVVQRHKEGASQVRCGLGTGGCKVVVSEDVQAVAERY